MRNSISIYIPTHNRPEMLDRALASLLEQSYKNFQVLVCNDGSVKNYSAIINKYKHSFNDFVYIENDHPMGACNARNKLINIADGEFITGLDDDDEFLPSRLEDFITAPELKNYAFLCAGHYTKTSRGVFRQNVLEGEILLQDLLSKNTVGNQVFVKTEMFQKSGAFDETFPAWQDYDAWVQLTKFAGNGYKIAKYNYRWNVDHEEGRISNSPKAKQGYTMFLEKHKELLSDRNIRDLYIQDAINRNDNIKLQWLLKNIDHDIIKIVLKYKLKKMFPGLKEWIYKT